MTDILTFLINLGEKGWDWKIHNAATPRCKICIRIKKRALIYYGYGNTPKEAIQMLRDQVAE